MTGFSLDQHRHDHAVLISEQPTQRHECADIGTSVPAACWRCDGSGSVWSESMLGWRECGLCDGTGLDWRDDE